MFLSKVSLGRTFQVECTRVAKFLNPPRADLRWGVFGQACPTDVRGTLQGDAVTRQIMAFYRAWLYCLSPYWTVRAGPVFPGMAVHVSAHGVQGGGRVREGASAHYISAEKFETQMIFRARTRKMTVNSWCAHWIWINGKALHCSHLLVLYWPFKNS